MNRTGIALLSAAALLASGSAMAGEMDGGSDISWTYLEAGYVKADGSDFSETDGYTVDGSLALGKNWHLGAAWTALSHDSDFSSGNVDSDTWAASFGYNAGFTKNSQAYFDVGYFDTSLDGEFLDGGEGDSSGFNLTAGFRYMPVPKVELGAAVTYTDGDVDNGSGSSDTSFNDTSVTVMGQYFFIPAFSLGAKVAMNGSSSGDALTVFLRYSFGGAGSDMSDSSN